MDRSPKFGSVSSDNRPMDFIEGLPKVQDKSVILIVVDHFSMYAHFIALSHLYTATSIVRAFFEGIVLRRGCSPP